MIEDNRIDFVQGHIHLGRGYSPGYNILFDDCFNVSEGDSFASYDFKVQMIPMTMDIYKTWAQKKKKCLKTCP